MALSLEQTTDIWQLGPDMRPEMPEVSGGECVAQRVLFAWQTPKGFFKWPGWQNRGCDARQALLDKAPLWPLKIQLEEEAKQDEQVDNCVVTPTLSDDGTFLYLDGLLFTKFGVFTFSMTITQAAGQLIALQAAA